jgi:hypothetical protein
VAHPRRICLLVLASVAALVAAPAIGAGPVLVTDSFHRTVAHGWGMAGSGGAWQVAGARFSVEGRAGTAVVAPASHVATASLIRVQPRDVQAQVAIWLAPASHDRTAVPFVQVRQGGGQAYRFWVAARGGRFVALGVSRVVAGVATTITTRPLVPAIDATTGLRLRVSATGQSATLLDASVWAAGATAPATWQLHALDGTAGLQQPGAFGLGVARTRASRPATVRFAALTLEAVPVPAPVDTVPTTSTAPVATTPTTPVATTPTAPVTTVPTTPAGPDPVLVGAGDIATCTTTRDEATAALVEAIPAATVFTFGDNAYPDGTAANFSECYTPSWGQFIGRTHPALGDDDYNTGSAAPYFAYFGAAAGNPAQGWYAVDLGTWRIYVLNSNCSFIGGCGAGSPQLTWLQQDLAANPRKCVAAIFHTPRFSSGTNGSTAGMQPIWAALVGAGAELALSGHDHDYERFQPLNAAGTPDSANGLRQLVVGTGGAGGGAFPTTQPYSVVRQANAIGIIEITLHAASYDFTFLSIPGRTFTDSGSGTCH